MGVFEDKRYEELDWISQATEPIESHVNDYMDLLPDKLEITPSMYVSFMLANGNSLSLSKRAILSRLTTEIYGREKLPPLTWEERGELDDAFSFTIEGEPIFDLENLTVTGGALFFYKSSTSINQDSLKKLLGSSGLSFLNGHYMVDPSRVNEIMDLIGPIKGINHKATRSPRQKKHILVRRVRELLTANEWNIKSTDLADKIPVWIRQYVESGNLSAMANICRLKVMTHRGLPIYSMEEVK